MSKNYTSDDAAGKIPGKPRILVAPLDWGLGHATRCIPVIYELINQQADVWLAGEGAQEALLRSEFPKLPFLSLNGYKIRYGHSAKSLIRNLFFQLPGIIRNIRKEHLWLNQVQATHKFDAIISDNRFGLHHSDTHTVFITHQLYIRSPWKWTEKIIQKRNYRFINKFDECWVPDNNAQPDLAGRLSHPDTLPSTPVHYIGPLSRLHLTNQPEQSRHLFISLSGPEPQRSMLENVLVNELSHYAGTATVVRGLPHSRNIIPSTNDLQFHNHLNAEEYSREMQKAELIISRSGYSTVMDIAKLGKQALFIPTPGQPEQEYLAEYLEQEGIAPFLTQKQFTLKNAIDTAANYKYKAVRFDNDRLKNTVENLLKRITQS